MVQEGALTLSDAVWPRVGVWQRDALRDVALVLGFTLLLALVAQIKITLPNTPVPITGQTFGVLLTGAALGSRRGAASALVYLGIGSAGLGVFAGWGSGLVWSFASGGFIIGFVSGAYVTGWLAERGWDRGPWILAAMLLGNIAIYVPGLLHLGFFVPWDKVLALGVLPFIPGDLIKLNLASLALPTAWALTLRVQDSVALPTTWGRILRLRPQAQDMAPSGRRTAAAGASAAAGFFALVAWSLLVATKMKVGVFDVTDLSYGYWLWLAASVTGLVLGLRLLSQGAPEPLRSAPEGAQ